MSALLAAIRREIKDIEDGKYDQKNNLLKVKRMSDIEECCGIGSVDDSKVLNRKDHLHA